MAKKYEISADQVEELERARKKNKDKNVDKRLKALLMRAEGRRNEEIGAICEFHPTHVSLLVSTYSNRGLSAIVENHYGGNHRNMSYAEEEALLEPFKQAAQSGQIVEVGAIKEAYEKAIGKSLENTHGQIYYVLQRHGWRKVMPRSKHPNKASEEDIESSKKLTKPSEMRWQILQVEMFD